MVKWQLVKFPLHLSKHPPDHYKMGVFARFNIIKKKKVLKGSAAISAVVIVRVDDHLLLRCTLTTGECHDVSTSFKV